MRTDRAFDQATRRYRRQEDANPRAFRDDWFRALSMSRADLIMTMLRALR